MDLLVGSFTLEGHPLLSAFWAFCEGSGWPLLQFSSQLGDLLLLQLDVRLLFFALLNEPLQHGLHGSHLFFKLLVSIVMNGMIIVLEDLTSFLIERLAWVITKKSHYYSNLLLHKVELATLKGFGLCPSNKTLFAASLVAWVKVLPFV